MATSIPPTDTPARQAMLDQGTDTYPGVDQWQHPKQAIPAGKLLIQFDYRTDADIRKGETTVSPYFTDADTLLKHMSPDGKVKARDLAEALQVKPYRPTDEGEHLYSAHISIYRVQQPIQAEDVQVSQGAKYAHGLTRNNVQYGEGVGTQYFLTEGKDKLVQGATPTLVLADVLPCIDRQHRLGWLQDLEKKNVNNDAITAAVKPQFQQQVNQMLQGSSQQQAHGREIAQLYQQNQQLKMNPPNTVVAAAKMAPPTPAPKQSQGPKPRRQGHKL